MASSVSLKQSFSTAAEAGLPRSAGRQPGSRSGLVSSGRAVDQGSSGVTYPGQRCDCCPYNYHIDLDFLRFLEAQSNPSNTLRSLRRLRPRPRLTDPQFDYGISPTPAHKTPPVAAAPINHSPPSGVATDSLATSEILRDIGSSINYSLYSVSAEGEGGGAKPPQRRLPVHLEMVLAPDTLTITSTTSTTTTQVYETEAEQKYRAETELFVNSPKVTRAHTPHSPTLERAHTPHSHTLERAHTTHSHTLGRAHTPHSPTLGRVSLPREARASTMPRDARASTPKTVHLEGVSWRAGGDEIDEGWERVERLVERIAAKQLASEARTETRAEAGSEVSTTAAGDMATEPSGQVTVTSLMREVTSSSETVTSSSQQLAAQSALLEGRESVSPAVLQAIRQQMAVSLQRMRDLEEQVKAMSLLQSEISILREENRRLLLLSQGHATANNDLDLTNEHAGRKKQPVDDCGTQTESPLNESPFTDAELRELYRWRQERSVEIRLRGAEARSKESRSVGVGDENVYGFFPPSLSMITATRITSAQTAQQLREALQAQQADQSNLASFSDSAHLLSASQSETSGEAVLEAVSRGGMQSITNTSIIREDQWIIESSQGQQRVDACGVATQSDLTPLASLDAPGPSLPPPTDLESIASRIVEDSISAARRQLTGEYGKHQEAPLDSSNKKAAMVNFGDADWLVRSAVKHDAWTVPDCVLESALGVKSGGGSVDESTMTDLQLGIQRLARDSLVRLLTETEGEGAGGEEAQWKEERAGADLPAIVIDESGPLPVDSDVEVEQAVAGRGVTQSSGGSVGDMRQDTSVIEINIKKKVNLGERVSPDFEMVEQNQVDAFSKAEELSKKSERTSEWISTCSEVDSVQSKTDSAKEDLEFNMVYDKNSGKIDVHGSERCSEQEARAMESVLYSGIGQDPIASVDVHASSALVASSGAPMTSSSAPLTLSSTLMTSSCVETRVTTVDQDWQFVDINTGTSTSDEAAPVDVSSTDQQNTQTNVHSGAILPVTSLLPSGVSLLEGFTVEQAIKPREDSPHKPGVAVDDLNLTPLISFDEPSQSDLSKVEEPLVSLLSPPGECMTQSLHASSTDLESSSYDTLLSSTGSSSLMEGGASVTSLSQRPGELWGAERGDGEPPGSSGTEDCRTVTEFTRQDSDTSVQIEVIFDVGNDGRVKSSNGSENDVMGSGTAAADSTNESEDTIVEKMDSLSLSSHGFDTQDEAASEATKISNMTDEHSSFKTDDDAGVGSKADEDAGVDGDRGRVGLGSEVKVSDDGVMERGMDCTMEELRALSGEVKETSSTVLCAAGEGLEVLVCTQPALADVPDVLELHVKGAAEDALPLPDPAYLSPAMETRAEGESIVSMEGGEESSQSVRTDRGRSVFRACEASTDEELVEQQLVRVSSAPEASHFLHASLSPLPPSQSASDESLPPLRGEPVGGRSEGSGSLTDSQGLEGSTERVNGTLGGSEGAIIGGSEGAIGGSQGAVGGSEGARGGSEGAIGGSEGAVGGSQSLGGGENLFGSVTPEKMFDVGDDLLTACSLYAQWLIDPDSVPAADVKQGLELVQRQWFVVAGRKLSSAQEVRLHLATFAQFGDALLEAVVNMPDNDGNTVLHYAVSHGNFEVVSALLECGVCAVDRENRAGYSALLLVALLTVDTERHQQLIHQLFSIGDVNAMSSSSGQTALMLAASHGRLETVALLLACGADVNAQDEDGSTALMCASEHGHTDIIRALLTTPGCDSTIADVDGSTALSIAVEEGHQEIGVLLYAHMKALQAQRLEVAEEPGEDEEEMEEIEVKEGKGMS